MDTLKELMPILAPVLVLQVILMAVALVDLSRREADRVKGPKWVWVLVSFLSMLGPIAYFIFGRKD